MQNFTLFKIILQSVELSGAAIEFLKGVFRLVDTDKVCYNFFWDYLEDLNTAMLFEHPILGGFLCIIMIYLLTFSLEK